MGFLLLTDEDKMSSNMFSTLPKSTIPKKHMLILQVTGKGFFKGLWWCIKIDFEILKHLQSVEELVLVNWFW
ncbi:MAG: hypothetical protein CM15mV18_1400 [uncultured marine virus]|nr:MAG: hypothetical protein CM15mV18_1400 [uncultured marine virus]